MQPTADLLCIPSRVRAGQRHYRLLGIHVHVDLSSPTPRKGKTLRRTCWRNSDSVAFTESKRTGQLRPEIGHFFEGQIAKGPAQFGPELSQLMLLLDKCAKEGRA